MICLGAVSVADSVAEGVQGCKFVILRGRCGELQRILGAMDDSSKVEYTNETYHEGN